MRVNILRETKTNNNQQLRLVTPLRGRVCTSVRTSEARTPRVPLPPLYSLRLTRRPQLLIALPVRAHVSEHKAIKMITPRLLAVFAVLACVAALPATDKPVPRPVTTITDEDFDDSPWFSFPLFGNLFAPLWRLLPSFGEIGPKIVADKDKFQVIVNVKDYKTEDLKVKVKGDFVFVQGSHEAKHDDHDIFASQFFHTYALPANSSGADVSAELSSDGYLVVGAPLRSGPVDRAKDADREVPIIETGRPYKQENATTTTASTINEEKTTQGKTTLVTKPTTLVESDDDRKEPTTPSSDREGVTEKDNNNYLGNEIL